MEKIVKIYRKRLYDLTTGNRSLLFLRMSSTQEIDISEFNFLDQHPAFHYMEELLTEKKNIRLSPVQEPRVEKVQVVSTTLKKIHRKLGQIFEERGLYECYVGWMFAEGKWKDGTPFRAPLLFFPIKLEVEGNYWLLKRESRSIQVNKSLLLAFAHYHDLTIPDEVLDENFEDFSADPLEFRTQLYEWLKKTKLEFLFSKEYFTNAVPILKTYKRTDFEEVYALGEMCIQPNAVLGIFPQAGSTIAADYDIWAQQLTETSLENFFADRNHITPPNDPNKEDLMTPYSMDASQEYAVREVLTGKSIVIQGPPGSGKSETICNMICANVAAGKKVLVVSHKRAALEVVAKRLEQKSLTDFYALVHDVKFDQRSLYNKINKQIENIEAFQSVNNGLDAIYLEREFAASAKVLTQLNTHSEDFRKALFESAICGYSAHELYLRTRTQKEQLNLSDIYTNYPARELDCLLNAVQTYSIYAHIPYPNADLWKNRIEMPALTSAAIETWKQQSMRLKNTIDAFSNQCARFESNNSKNTFVSIGTCIDSIKNIQHKIQHSSTAALWDTFVLPTNMLAARAVFSKIQRIADTYKECFQNYSLDELQALHAILIVGKQKVSNPISWVFYTLFSSSYKKIKSFAKTINIKLQANNLQQVIDINEELLSLKSSIQEIRLYSSVEIDFKNTATLKEQLEDIEHLSSNLEEINLQDPRLHAYMCTTTSEALLEFLTSLIAAHEKLSTERSHSQTYFSAKQQELFLEDSTLLTAWMAFIETHINDIQHLDLLLESLNSNDRLCLQGLAQMQDQSTAATWRSLVEQSILSHWIERIELVYPILKSLDTMMWKQFAQDWAIHSEKRKGLSLEMILGKLREQTYRDIVFNRLQNRVTYRDLQHQVTKKKRIWPVRKLMQEYATEVFSLIPCWMMSSEQVSCVFPLEQLFDVIIIDEASQCYTEHSLPAMYRAKQIVIAGDSQQLSPSDLYRVRWEDEDENEADIEIDSLLDLGSRYLSTVMLSGHYRSRYPELISFSNQQFYGNKLNYIPSYNDMHSNVKPITYKKVAGVWASSINKIEAEEVVRTTFELIQACKKSIGIVCFNYQQASYIQELLEETSLAKQIALPEALFVKNIENVQGDERDIIIFSVAYAPDKNGKFAMQFGSLNMQGGEKRMNVAVSRAREAVIVVSSIMPQELRTENAKHDGPRILKEYLQYAWDCQQFDRNTFFSKHATPISSNSTAQAVMDICAEQTKFKAQAIYPFASLTITHNNQHTLIDTDDDAYRSVAFAKYWHYNKPMLFAQKGWQYKQVLSKSIHTKAHTNWITDIFQSEQH